MSPERVWSDLYGCPRALWSGLPGGHTWLVVAPPRLVGQVAGALDALRFKGAVYLLVTEDLTPLESALREVSPRGAVVVGETLSGGPSLQLPPRTVLQPGFSYQEGGDLPEWTSALRLDAARGACPPASACARQGVPVVSADVKDLARTLQMWWAQTPHSLAHV
ncbi:hypothetical protein [Deinococcus peraridilitoris]|uniref:Uncharacterized protein n=1 Tax=Deinococcus peraridilitoris (strain DSM 19664 / LMG 22246 / CIP 109416 / KR-200) TaxID=937777 RepID=L0A266_DEIPD|nr:hypothetical protein [Deinococcus peraridilitoris]AFZ67267.1 hypothetical protein Deipe_1748 [Deinococcus peraridilitoris DSM 19664]